MARSTPKLKAVRFSLFTLGPRLFDRDDGEDEGRSLLSSIITVSAILTGAVIAGVSALAVYRFLTGGPEEGSDDEEPTEENPAGKTEPFTLDPGPIPRPDESYSDAQKRHLQEKKQTAGNMSASVVEATRRFESFLTGNPYTPPNLSRGVTMDPAIPLTSTGLVKLTPLKEGTRYKFTFPNTLPGAEGLSKNGSYTEAEVFTIISLKSFGADTSASGKMPAYVYDYIMERAPAYGLDPIAVLSYVAIESGGNPNAISPTGAIGVLQFTGATANDYGLLNRFDYKANIEAGLKLAANNSRRLAKLGIQDDDLSLYIAHQIGYGGAREVLAVPSSTPIASLSASTQKNIKVNVGGRSATVGEYLATNRSSLDQSFKVRVASVHSERLASYTKGLAPTASNSISTAPTTTTAQATTPKTSVGAATNAPVLPTKSERLTPAPVVAAAAPKATASPAPAPTPVKTAAVVPQNVILVNGVPVTTTKT